MPTMMDIERRSEASQFSQITGMIEGLPELHMPRRKRILLLFAGIGLAILDLGCLPLTYYYALKFDTKLSLQIIFAVITALYGFLSFSHYGLRSLRLFRAKTAPKWRPIGWTKWGMFEFLQINILIVITLVEIELIAGTAPEIPIVRLCAMPSPTICFYLGGLFLGSAVLTQMGQRLPFNMSSTAKGQLWRPALLAFVEDAGAVEAQGGVEHRKQVMKRYEVSPRFRHMILLLSWGWGIGLLLLATVSTVLIMELSEDIGFGIGWGLPWAGTAVFSIATVFFVGSSLRKEKAEWITKELESAANFDRLLDPRG